MTRTQYLALIEVADKGEFVAPHFLNIRPQTVVAIAKRGWIKIENGRAVVTPAGWEACP